MPLSTPSSSTPYPVPSNGARAARWRADAIILAGSVGPDAAWSCGAPRPLLPVCDTTLIDNLLEKLAATTVGSHTLCVNDGSGAVSTYVRKQRTARGKVEFYTDVVPRGTAGCVKACEHALRSDVFFVIGGSVWLADDPRWMLEQHRASGNVMTVFCAAQADVHSGDHATCRTPAGVYLCSRAILDYIPKDGYFDLKEQLVPALRAAGCRVGAVTLHGGSREVVDWNTYSGVMSSAIPTHQGNGSGYRQLAPDIWYGRDVHIAPSARVVGPVILGHRCRLGDDSIVIGPAILGDDSHVGARSMLVRVVTHSGTVFGEGTSVSDTLYPPSQGAGGADRTTESVALSGWGMPAGSMGRAGAVLGVGARWVAAGARGQWLAGASVACLFVWAFWPTFASLWGTWQSRPDYSAGALAPFAALYLAVGRRRELPRTGLKCDPLGLCLFGVGLAVSLLGTYYLFASLSNVGMVLCANGVILALLGRQAYRHLWLPCAFLFLMVPLPGRVHDAVMLPLQSLGAQASAAVLEVIGVPALRHGNILEVGGFEIAVAEACSGLRMALAFVMVSAFMAGIIRRPGWQKTLVVLSSLPIALGCNVVRIVLSACLFNAGHERLAQGLFHDATGFMMMPVAVGLVLLELRLLSRLQAELGNGDPPVGALPGIRPSGAFA